MDFFAGILAKGKRCPDGGKQLVPESSIGFDGMSSEQAWNSVYQSVYLVRRPRLVCMNPKCKSFYRKTYHKFVVNLLGNVVDEHFLSDAMRKNRKK